MADDDGPGAGETVSRADFQKLQAQMKEYGDALDELRTATTAQQEQEAREGVREEKADLDALAKEMGLSPSKLREAADEARRKETKETLRPILAELLDEELDKGDAKAAEEKEAEEKAAAAAKAEEGKPEPKPKPDTGPRTDHWSERPIADLLK